MRERLLLALSALMTLFLLAWVLWFCRYGLDFTDESFYLVWMSNPFIYPGSASQFGFVYHPLYALVDGDIGLLRQTNAVVTVGLAVVMGGVFQHTVLHEASLKPWPRIVIAAALATAALSCFLFAGTWLPTPSYNSLNLQGLLLAATGLMCAEKHVGKLSIAGWVLLGIGGWLVFMAKPTTAIILAVLAMGYLGWSGKFNIRLVIASAVLALLLLGISAMAIDGSVVAFVSRLEQGLAPAAILGSGHAPAELLRVDSFFLGATGRSMLLAVSLGAFIAAYLVQARSRKLVFAGIAVSSGFVLLSLATLLAGDSRTFHIGQFQGMLQFSVPFALVLFAFFTSQSNDLASVPRRTWVLGLAFLLLPYAYAFGTGDNYWVMASGAGIFWVFAGCVLLQPAASKPEFTSVAVVFGIAAQLVMAVTVQEGMAHPYRQTQALRDNDYRIEIGRTGSTLVLSQAFGKYFASAIDQAGRAGFRRDTPMIDLSGRSPGVLYAMGARSIGQAWTLGGYPGSARLVTAMLKNVSCRELAAAWVLLEPEGLGAISQQVLLSFGADPSADFAIAGTFTTAPGAGSHKNPKTQHILRPTRAPDVAARACMTTRSAAP